MRIRTALFAMALCGSGTFASAATLLGETPIGLSGTFTMDITNCSGPVSGTFTASYVKNTVTGVVTLSLPALLCTSSAVPTTLTNLPVEIRPASAVRLPILVIISSSTVPGELSAAAGASAFTLGVWNGSSVTPGGWVTGQVKGILGAGMTVTYLGTPDT